METKGFEKYAQRVDIEVLNLPTRVINALHKGGVYTLWQLHRREWEVRYFEGIGEKSLYLIRNVLETKRKNLTFKESCQMLWRAIWKTQR